MNIINTCDVRRDHVLATYVSDSHFDWRTNATTATDLLDYLAKNGKINLEEATEELMNERRRTYLHMHPYAISFDRKNRYWRTTLPDSSKRGGRRFVKKRRREDIEAAVIDFYIADETRKKYSVEAAMMEFIEHHYGGENQQPSKRKARYDYARFFSDIGSRSILEMDEHAWQLVLEDIVAKRHPKRRAFSNACCLLRMTLRYLKKRDRIRLDINSIFEELEVDENMFDPSKKPEESQFFTYEEAVRLVSYLWAHRENPRNLLLLLIYATGLRIGEAASLKHEDITEHSISINRTLMGDYIDDAGNNVRAEIKEAPKTKAGRRSVVISEGSDKLMDAVRAMNPGGEYIFLNEKGELLTDDAVRCHLYRVCEKELVIPKRTTHALRKTYASILDESGMEDAGIIRQMGHSSIKTTRRFYIKNRRDEDAMREKLSMIPDLDISGIIESVMAEGTQGTQNQVV